MIILWLLIKFKIETLKLKISETRHIPIVKVRLSGNNSAYAEEKHNIV